LRIFEGYNVEGKKIVPVYLQSEPDEKGRRIAKGTLKRGLTIGNERHKEFVMRQAVMGDLFRAEEQVPSNQMLKFNAAIWSQTLCSLGSYDGPITIGMLELISQEDYAILRDAQMELDVSGESQ
jgi:phage FluMu protein gp41